MSSGKGLDLLEQRLSQALFPGVGLSPEDLAMILAIIDALTKALQECKKPTPQSLRQGPFHRWVIARALRKGMDVSWAESFTKADLVIPLAKQATDSELQMLIDDCCCCN